jgi:DNA-binding response OmpR family regulator
MNSEHILICEDDEACLLSLSFILENDGYMISSASDGNMAAEIIFSANKGSIPVDLLITDLHMPKLNGLQLIRHIRNSGFNIPVIVITGYGDREVLKELIKIGCNDFLDKPFNPTELRNKVSEVFRKQHHIKAAYEKKHADLLKKQSDMMREIETYKSISKRLQREFDTAVVAYHDLISIKNGGYNVPIAYYIKPLSQLGGDYADICNTTNGCDIFIADVAGHDMAASYHTILLKAFFDQNCRSGKDGKTFFHLLNHALLDHGMDHGKNERMITALFLRLNLKNMCGEVVSAGHPGIIKLSEKLPITISIGSNGTIMGLYKDVSFESKMFRLSPMERLFLYTDGIINAYYVDGPSGKRHTLHKKGLEEMILKYNKLPLELHLEKVWNEVLRFCRYKPSDDMLLFAVEIPEIKH